MKIYDCIIVGAGIAGLIAGRKLKDLDILVIDKKSKVGSPLKCGEGACKETWDKYCGKDSVFIRNKIEKNKFKIIDGDKITEKIVNIPFYQIDRPAWEKWLSKEIKDKVKCNVGCNSLERIDNVWYVDTNIGKIASRTVILAHGCNFNIQKKLGLCKNLPSIATLYFGLFSNYNQPKDEFVFSYSNKHKSTVGFWAFPKNDDIVNAGVAAIQSDVNLKDEFNYFTEKLKLDLKPIEIQGGIFPLDGPINNIIDDGLIICGDAAGFNYAFSGEGIKYAIISGSKAGEVLRDAIRMNTYSKIDLKKYEQFCKDSFYNELKAGVMLKNISEWIYQRHPNKITKMFMKGDNKTLSNLRKGIIPLKLKILNSYIKLRGHDGKK